MTDGIKIKDQGAHTHTAQLHSSQLTVARPGPGLEAAASTMWYRSSASASASASLCDSPFSAAASAQVAPAASPVRHVAAA